MKIEIEKIISRLEEIYKCGELDDGTHARVVFSPEDIKGREKFTGYFKELGIIPRMDEAGNLIFRMEGKNPELPAIVMGSHLDTVPDGGKYDGVLGCMGGLGVCEAFSKAGYVPEHPVEVVVFTDEEGFRFGNGLLGSSAFAGEDPKINETDLDMYGLERKDVMQSYGIQVSEVPRAAREKNSVHCFLELHIEQGANLYKNKKPIGVVSSIAGVSRYEIQVSGEANHSGSTMMGDRKDALVTAAHVIAKIPEIVSEHGGEFTVATVGTIKAVPNSVNVIPSDCIFKFEIRDPDAGMITLIEANVKQYLDTICNKHNCKFEMKQISYHDPAPMTDWVKEAVKEASEELEYEYSVIPSGAFHDSLLLAPVFPTGMIFIPSVGGISHSPRELSLKEDIEKGCNVLLQTVLNIDQKKNNNLS